MMKTLILSIAAFLAFTTAGRAQPTIAWTQTNFDTGIGYSTIRYDPVARGMIVLGKSAGIGIFATDVYEYSMATGLGTHIVGTGSAVDTCPADLPASYGGANPGGLPNRPGDRHPVNQQAVDDKRGFFIIGGGINRCAGYTTGGSFSISGSTATAGLGEFPVDGSWVGARVYVTNSANCPNAGTYCTIASVASNGLSLTFTAPGPGTITGGTYGMFFVDPGAGGASLGTWQDLYYLTLNANPTLNTWTRLFPAHFPSSISGGSYYYQGSFAYDSADDNLFMLEGNHLFRYCMTIGNSPSGLSAAQTASGCSSADDWTLESITASPASVYVGFAYDSSRKIFWAYGGVDGANTVSYNNLWAYNPGGSTRFGIASHAWQQFGLTSPPPAEKLATSQKSSIDYNSVRRTLLYHRPRNANDTVNPQDWEYTPDNDTWTLLASSPSGSSNTNGVEMAFDPITNRLVSMGAGADKTWQGQLSGSLAISTPLTLQEATGDLTGVARIDEPWCMGIPVADSAGITATTTLTLPGQEAGQFRILGNWPSGNAKWIKSCGVHPALDAGALGTTILSTAGGGNFGGSNLATDNGATITVATGAATFTVKKANFNILDIVVVGATTVVATSASATRGLVLTGPDPTAGTTLGKVTCSPDTGGSTCATVYSSANDSSSTCSVEENGPVMAVIRCMGNLIDGAAHAYMQYTVREYFYKNKTSMKSMVVLRNANYDTSATPSPDCNFSGGICQAGTFNTAFKGVKSLEIRIDPTYANTGNITYTIATDTTPQTGTLNQTGGTDFAFIYQGQSTWMVPSAAPDSQYCQPGTSYCANKMTLDQGYVAYKNATSLASGNNTKVIGGWMDCSDSTGRGLEIGIEQMAAAWPASLECNAGGTDVRIGLWSQQNGVISTTPKYIYMPWPQWKEFESFVEFHTSNPASLAGDFKAYQAPVLARGTLAYMNGTSVFPYPFIDPATEDAYYVSTQAAASPQNSSVALSHFCYGSNTAACTPDRSFLNAGIINTGMAVGIYRYYAASQGGSLNQEEFRWGDMLKFLQRGYTGRWLNSKYYYRWQAETHVPHHDGTSGSNGTMINGFTWSGRTNQGVETETVTGSPKFYSRALNNGLQFGANGDSSAQWRDYLHDHWYGMVDHYFLTGDETVKEAIVSYEDWYLNTSTSVYGLGAHNNMGSTRAFGALLLGAGRLSAYLYATGDSTNGAAVLQSGVHNFDNYIDNRPCEGGYVGGVYKNYPAGCTAPNLNTDIGTDFYGVDLNRGNHSAGRESAWCPSPYNDTTTVTSDMTSSQTTFQVNALAPIINGGKNLALLSGNEIVKVCNTSGTTVSVGVASCPNVDGRGYDGTTAVAHRGVIFDGSTISASSTGTSPIVTVSGYTVAASDVGNTIFISGGTNFRTGFYTISSVNTGANQWTMNTNISTGAGSGMTGYEGDKATNNTSNLTGNYRLQQSFIESILSEGLMSFTQNYPTWAKYNRARDLAYGITQHAFNEEFMDDGLAHWTDSSGIYNGFIYDRTIDFPAACPAITSQHDTRLVGPVAGVMYDPNGIANGSQGIYFTFWTLYKLTGDVSWARKLKIAMQRGATAVSAWLGDWGMYSISANIWALSNPPASTLQEISFTATDLGSGNYQLHFTPPSGTCTNAPECLRIKWSPNAIQKTIGAGDQLLQFDSMNTQSFGISPDTNATWFGSNNAETTGTVPTPTPGTAMNVTVATGTTGLSAAANSVNFSVKATFPTACSITTTSFPAATVGQSYSQTAAQGGCSSSTWSVSSGSLPAWASLNTSTGAITGTVSGSAGTATFTLSYGTATSGSISITTNLAPSVTTNSLPAGTLGSAYGVQTIATSGGSGTVSCVANSGVPTGMTVHANCTIDGTPSASGSFTVNVTPTDTNSISGASHNISLTINSSACSITTTSFPGATIGQAYSQTAAQSGCSASTWSVASGSLPAWASLNAASGAITGTVSGAAGTATFTLAYSTATSGSLSITTSLAPATGTVMRGTVPKGITGH